MREMKDSGVEWIGSIPKEWCISYLGYVCDEFIVPMRDKPKKFDGDIPWCRIEDLEGGYLNDSLSGQYVSNEVIDELNLKVYPVGTVISSCSATIGVNAITTRPLCTNQTFIGLVAGKNLYNRYLFYVMEAVADYLKFNGHGSTITYISQDKYRKIAIPFPNINEQKTITDYLDSKCSQIDSIISKQEAIIEKLKEYKLSVITEAVTKGLNPDVEMKDSGIEWIGTIPIDWHIVKLSTIAKTSSGATPNRSNFEENFIDANIRWIRTLDLNDWYVYDSSEKITEFALSKSSCQIMPVNTVCVAMYGGAGTIGKCGLLKEEAATNQAICSIVTGCKMRPEYLLLQLHAIRKYWMKYAVGTRKDPNISQEIVSRMQVVLPPVDVQEDIIKKIMPLCEVIDTQIRKVEDIIEKQKELKKSLIYEVVTGKKEV